METRLLAALAAAALLLFLAAPADALDSAGSELFGDSGGSLGTGAPPPENQQSPAAGSPLDILPTDRQPDGPVMIELTGDWVIEGDCGLVLVNQRFQSTPPSELAGMLGYPGIAQPVTILTGGHQIVVRNGGSLTLQEFDGTTPELRVEGEHVGGLFRVEEGGSLCLNQVHVRTSGVAVRLEEGADYIWGNANREDYPKPSTAGVEGVCVLGPAPTLTAPAPLLVFDDTAWSDNLPAARFPSLEVICSVDGTREESPRRLPVVWDTAARAKELAARQDCVLEGWFPDGDGGRLKAKYTPTLAVRFLPRGPVKILKTRFVRTGAGDYYGELRFETPVDWQAVRLEVSADGGASWAAIEGAVRFLEEGFASFQQPDDRQRLYRIAVEGGPNGGASEPVALPAKAAPDKPTGGGDDDGNDFGGSRGGGTALETPSRAPAPLPPEEKPAAQQPESAGADRVLGDTRPGRAENGGEAAPPAAAPQGEAAASGGRKPPAAESPDPPRGTDPAGEAQGSALAAIAPAGQAPASGGGWAAAAGIAACAAVTAAACVPAPRALIVRFLKRLFRLL